VIAGVAARADIEATAMRRTAHGGKECRHMRRIIMLVAIVALALAVSPALAGKGGNGSGKGGGNGQGKGSNRSAPTLVATPDVLHAGEYFDVSGCGYATEYGNVIVAFTGGSWGSPLDENGCFSIPDIPALSGDTLPPGTYSVTAYQYVNNGLRKTGETTVTVVS
jgi:hypothetical protein